ncbi:hypothetical protein DYB35_006991, partial [Aphanomyces astaci]
LARRKASMARKEAYEQKVPCLPLKPHPHNNNSDDHAFGTNLSSNRSNPPLPTRRPPPVDNLSNFTLQLQISDATHPTPPGPLTMTAAGTTVCRPHLDPPQSLPPTLTDSMKASLLARQVLLKSRDRSEYTVTRPPASGRTSKVRSLSHQEQPTTTTTQPQTQTTPRPNSTSMEPPSSSPPHDDKDSNDDDDIVVLHASLAFARLNQRPTSTTGPNKAIDLALDFLTVDIPLLPDRLHVLRSLELLLTSILDEHPDCLRIDDRSSYRPLVAAYPSVQHVLRAVGYTSSSATSLVLSLDQVDQSVSALAAKQRGGVGMDSLVQRQVVRVVTPGSLTEDSMLLPTQNNYLASISKEPDQSTCHIAYTDISTGEFLVLTVHMDDVDSELTRLQPSELLVPAQYDVANAQDSTWWRQRLDNAMNALGTVVTFRKQVSMEFANSDASVAAASMIHEYLAYTHVGTPSSYSHACKPSSDVRQLVGRMRFDVSVWRSLELTKVTPLGYNAIGL